MQTRLNYAVTFVVFASLSMFASSAFGQWTGKVTLGDTTAGQPALATFSSQGRLYLAFTGTDGNETINVMSSADGFNYGNKVVLSNFRSINGYGPGLSEVPNCGSLFLSYVGGGHAVNISTSSDGINWSPQNIVASIAYTPAVVSAGNSTYGRVAFADGAGIPRLQDFTSCVGAWLSDDCFIFVGGNCLDGGIPLNGAPGLAASAAVDLRDYAAQGAGGQINYGNNSGWFQSAGNWSNQGPSAAVDVSTGNRYIAWIGSGGGINIQNVNSGAQVISGDWSSNTPVLAVFSGQLFVAWRGGTAPYNINVASINLF
jgi:hypothetical protein